MGKTAKDELAKLTKQEEQQLYSPEGIHYRFAGYYKLGSKEQERLLFTALSKLPKEAVDFAESILFVSSTPDAGGAQTLLLPDKSNYKTVIHLEPKFWEAKSKEVEEGIAHEVAHAFLKHRFDTNNNLKDIEKEADDLAGKWLRRKAIISQKHSRQSFKHLKQRLQNQSVADNHELTTI